MQGARGEGPGEALVRAHLAQRAERRVLLHILSVPVDILELGDGDGDGDGEEVLEEDAG